MKTTKNSNDIAGTIIKQLGFALRMMGAKNLINMGDGLQFKIGSNPKRVTHVTITLAADDTYAIKFQRVPGPRALMNGAPVVDLAELAGVYVDNLHSTLEAETGLYTRL